MDSVSVPNIRNSTLPGNGNGREVQTTNEQGAFQRIVLHAFGLRPTLRDVFLLCDIQGVTMAEAAAILSISPAVVATRLARARREVNALVESDC